MNEWMDDNDHDNDHPENLQISLHIMGGSSLVWNE